MRDVVEELPEIVEWLFLDRVVLRDGATATSPLSSDQVADTEANDVLAGIEPFAAGAKVLQVRLRGSQWVSTRPRFSGFSSAAVRLLTTSR